MRTSWSPVSYFLEIHIAIIYNEIVEKTANVENHQEQNHKGELGSTQHLEIIGFKRELKPDAAWHAEEPSLHIAVHLKGLLQF